MIAYGKMKDSEAFRNYCRAIGLKMEEYNDVGKDLDSYRDHPKWKQIIEESKKFIGVIDSASPHPCAFLLLDKPISEEIGLMKLKSQNSKNETIVALIDSGISDQWKYLKNDFLTVTVWEIINETFKLIGKPIPSIRELTALLDDKVWKLYEKGLVATLNQTGTDSGRPQVMRYKPKSVSELAAWVAAIRPAFASMKEIFLDRKPFSYGIKEFDELLKDSNNFILYQENIMATLIYAGFPEDETYGLLKAIAKKKPGIIEPIHDRFIKGFIERTGNKENALKVWEIIESAVNYGFNSSHSLSVAYDSLYGAYAKAHYPLEYYSVILNIYEDNQDETNKIYHELDEFGIKIKPIKFGKSGAKYSPDKENNTIVKGLKSIKYLNDTIADELLELSKNYYDDFVDLLVDIKEKTSVNARQLRILIELNFFDQFGGNKYLLSIFEFFDKQYSKTHKDETKQNRIKLVKEYASKIPNEPLSISEQLMREKFALGYIQSTYPELPKTQVAVVDINTKYSPKLTLYQLATGKEIEVKMSRNVFYNYEGEPVLQVGDIIQIGKPELRNKRKKVGDQWVETNEKEYWLSHFKVVERAK